MPIPLAGEDFPFTSFVLSITSLPAGDKHRLLAQSDSLSIRPRRLYLQILQETGGGHQVQLPVATLGSFFGVGKGQSWASKSRAEPLEGVFEPLPFFTEMCFHTGIKTLAREFGRTCGEEVLH